MGFKILSFKSVQLIAVSFQLIAEIAEVVKLANTLRSGRSGRKLLRVQVSPSAILNLNCLNYTLVKQSGFPPEARLAQAKLERQLPSSAHVETCGRKS